MLFSGYTYIAVSVRIMQHYFATAQYRYSNHRVWKVEGYTSTYVKFEDREHQVTDSARCVRKVCVRIPRGVPDALVQ